MGMIFIVRNTCLSVWECKIYMCDIFRMESKLQFASTCVVLIHINEHGSNLIEDDGTIFNLAQYVINDGWEI